MGAPATNDVAVTWLGHASAAISSPSTRLLIDPLGRRRALQGGTPSAILITHAHVDHLNRYTLKALPRDVPLVVPYGARHIVTDLGFRQVIEAQVGDELQLGDFHVTAVATAHDQGRWRKSQLPSCVGYVAASGDVRVHHAGDVDFSDFSIFDEIGKRHALAATLLPIGGMLPVAYYRWRKTALNRGIHIDPDAAIAIYERLGARAMIPVHWGTVNLRLSPAHMPKARLLQVADPSRHLVHILAHHESLALTT